MGVSTKGVVITPVKDVLAVCRVVEQALNGLIRAARRAKYAHLSPRDPQVREAFSDVDMRIVPSASHVVFSFVYDGQSRQLSFFFDCDCDHVDLAPKTLSYSLGCWGSSELIARTVAQALSVFGPALVDVNDCDDVPAVALERQLSVLEAVAAGVFAMHVGEGLVDKFLAGELPVQRSFEQFVGITERSWRQRAAVQEPQQRWDAMQAQAHRLYPAAAALRDSLLQSSGTPAG